MSITIGISSDTPALHQSAQQFAENYHFPFVADFRSPEAKHMAYLLLFTEQAIGLHDTSDKKMNLFYIDFSTPTLMHRIKLATYKNELLARAIGVKPQENARIVDATAGLGRDSFILASLGYQITMLEISPLIHLMLQDALKRASLAPSLQGIVNNLTLINTNALNWLPQQQTDIIYLDPMFPERKKSASVKKEMVILQNVLPKVDNSLKLLEVALACAKKRVVVKRPRLAAKIGDYAVNFTLTGKSSRFDVYLSGK